MKYTVVLFIKGEPQIYWVTSKSIADAMFDAIANLIRNDELIQDEKTHGWVINGKVVAVFPGHHVDVWGPQCL